MKYKLGQKRHQSVGKVGSFTFAKYLKKENKAKVNVPTRGAIKIILKNSVGKILKLFCSGCGMMVLSHERNCLKWSDG